MKNNIGDYEKDYLSGNLTIGLKPIAVFIAIVSILVGGGFLASKILYNRKVGGLEKNVNSYMKAHETELTKLAQAVAAEDFSMPTEELNKPGCGRGPDFSAREMLVNDKESVRNLKTFIANSSKMVEDGYRMQAYIRINENEYVGIAANSVYVRTYKDGPNYMRYPGESYSSCMEQFMVSGVCEKAKDTSGSPYTYRPLKLGKTKAAAFFQYF